jgi:WD40 repeat protein
MMHGCIVASDASVRMGCPRAYPSSSIRPHHGEMMTRLRRAVGIFVTLSVTTMAAGAIFLMTAGPIERRVTDATVIAGIAGLVSVFPMMTSWLRLLLSQKPDGRDPKALVDQLAGSLEDEWKAEAASHLAHHRDSLPIRWKVRPALVSGIGKGANSRIHTLPHRLEGDIDEIVLGLARNYSSIHSGRMVIVGEPGSGKTVIGILLTLGIIRLRHPGDPVPVLAPASTWDAATVTLADWLASYLADMYYGGRDDTPRLLIEQGLITPIVDGLDEISEPYRPRAAAQIQDFSKSGHGIVVTCRAREYDDDIRRGAPSLHRASVVEVQPLTPSDVISYLQIQDSDHKIDFRSIYPALESSDWNPLKDTLSTPLLVSTLLTVCRGLPLDPEELLNAERFDSRLSIENFLIDSIIPSAFPESGSEGLNRGWMSGRAGNNRAAQWLVNLSHYLHDTNQRGIAWWHLANEFASPRLGTYSGLVSMILFISVSMPIWLNPDLIGFSDSTSAFEFAASIGFVLATLMTIQWYANPRTSPGVLTLGRKRQYARIYRAVKGAMRLAPLMFLAEIAFVLIDISIGPDGWRMSDLVYLGQSTVTFFVAMGMLAGAVALEAVFNAAPEGSVTATPGNILRSDRVSSLVGCLISSTFMGIFGIPAAFVGIYAGSLFVHEVTQWPGYPGDPLPDLLFRGMIGDGVNFHGNAWLIALEVLILGLSWFLLTAINRAWPRFKIAQFWLWARGQTPWRLMEFLEVAQERGVLRRQGGIYQFRHIRLQEHLAQKPRGSHLGVLARFSRMAPTLSSVLISLLVVGIGLIVTNLNRFPHDAARLVIRDNAYDVRFSGDGKQISLINYVPGKGDAADTLSAQVYRTADGMLVGGPISGIDVSGGDEGSLAISPDLLSWIFTRTHLMPNRSAVDDVVIRDLVSGREQILATGRIDKFSNIRNTAFIELDDKTLLVKDMSDSSWNSLRYSRVASYYPLDLGARVLLELSDRLELRSTRDGSLIWSRLLGSDELLDVSRDGKYLAMKMAGRSGIVGDSMIAVEDLSGAGHPLTILKSDDYLSFSSFDSSSTDFRVTIGARDARNDVVSMWSLASWKRVVLPVSESVADISRDGTRILLKTENVDGDVISSRTVSFPDVRQIGPTLTFRKGVDSIEFSPDGLYSIFKEGNSSNAHDGDARIFDSMSGEQRNPSKFPLGDYEFSSRRDLLIDSWMAAKTKRSFLQLWNLRTGLRIGPEISGGKDLSYTFSADGSILATYGYREVVDIWDTGTGILLDELSGHLADVRSVYFSGNNIVASVGADSTVRIWTRNDSTERS